MNEKFVVRGTSVHSSVVEHIIANDKVEGSNPSVRSMTLRLDIFQIGCGQVLTSNMYGQRMRG